MKTKRSMPAATPAAPEIQTWDVVLKAADGATTVRRIDGDLPTVHAARTTVEQRWPELAFVSAESVNPDVRPAPEE